MTVTLTQGAPLPSQRAPGVAVSWLTLLQELNEQVSAVGRRRRKHSDEFKAQVVTACSQPGVSIAAVSMAHGVNANLGRRWVSEAGEPEPVAPQLMDKTCPLPFSSRTSL